MARSAIRRGIYAVQVLVLGAMMLTTAGTASHRSTIGDPTAGTLADLPFETAVALSPAARNRSVVTQSCSSQIDSR